MIAIIGAGGHAKCVYECFYQSKINIYGFFDDDPNLIGQEVINSLSCLGTIADVTKFKVINSIFVAIGDNRQRLEKYQIFESSNYKFPNAIHRQAYISDFAKLGRGVFVMGASMINPHTQVDDYCIINTSATIGHECCLGRAVQVSPGVNIAGGCIIEEGVFIGIGAKLAPGVSVGAWSVVGAGSVVLENIPANSFYYGIPAKPDIKRS